MNDSLPRWIAAVMILPLAACTAPERKADAALSAVVDPVDASAQAAFLSRLNAMCGQAFAGRLVSDDDADADMASADMVMHIRECAADDVRIPFHIETADGWDRSRTWVVRRTADGLQLKHDHRHEDGSEDAVTMYGGDTAAAGTADRQEFLVDDESISLFQREGLTASVTNVWAMEVDEERFAYELKRVGENERFFRVEFDLTQAVPVPPAPWGAT